MPTMSRWIRPENSEEPGRASGRTASSSRAIIVKDTIDVSSTTMTSWGSRLSR